MNAVFSYGIRREFRRVPILSWKAINIPPDTVLLNEVPAHPAAAGPQVDASSQDPSPVGLPSGLAVTKPDRHVLKVCPIF